QHSASIMQQRLVQSLSPGNLLSGVLETKELAERLPERLNRILDRLANNEIAIKVDAIDENVLMVGVQKVANRITMGLLLAALIISLAVFTDRRAAGAAMLAIARTSSCMPPSAALAVSVATFTALTDMSFAVSARLSAVL